MPLLHLQVSVYSAALRRAWSNGTTVTVPRLCGFCANCRERIPLTGSSSVTAVAVEMIPSTLAALRTVSAKFSRIVPDASLHAVLAAASDVAGGVVEVPNGSGLTGEERCSLGDLASNVSCGLANKHGVRGTAPPPVARVNITTIDALTVEFGLSVVDWLSIDAEGYDARVLRGAAAVLGSGKVRLVEFEYHSTGLWATLRLADTLRWLEGFGFKCFWQGDVGALAPAVSECGDELDFRAWSNLVCSREPALVLALMTLVRDDRSQ